MKRLLSAAALLTALACHPAAADEPLKMVGTWKGMATVVHIGSNPYRVAAGNGAQMPSNAIEFTYRITEQQGNRFAGTSTNGKYTETVIGALEPNNRGGIMLDDDGQYVLSVEDQNTIGVCYNHSFPTSRVVGCWTLKREQ